MNRDKIIEALESSLEKAEKTGKKIRLHYLLAKFYLSKDDIWSITHYFEAEDLLEYAGENGLIGFKNFYRYREKLENLQFHIDSLMFG